MTGTSLGSSQTASTMNEYLAYYEKEGFEFSKDQKKDQKEISNVTEFLKQQVESGELKYLIKEAHSDGDDKNLFRMSTKANLLVGVNRKTIEKIYLAFPSPADNNSTLLSNQEFGQWIREKEKKGGGQIVYFNTSCGSKLKAIHEIEATQSPLLLNIPTMNTTETFTTSDESAERLLFTAFRNGKNYDEMRAELSKNEKYKNDSGNGFIFPDESRYKNHITQVLATPLKMDVHVTTADGSPYQFDQNVH